MASTSELNNDQDNERQQLGHLASRLLCSTRLCGGGHGPIDLLTWPKVAPPLHSRSYAPCMNENEGPLT